MVQKDNEKRVGNFLINESTDHKRHYLAKRYGHFDRVCSDLTVQELDILILKYNRNFYNYEDKREIKCLLKIARDWMEDKKLEVGCGMVV